MQRSPVRSLAYAQSLLLLLASTAAAQVLRGTVVDDTTHTPIPAAQITLLGDSGRVLMTRTADSLGVFEMPLPRADSVALRVESIGYETVTTRRLSADRGELVSVEVRLSPRALPLNPLVVVARNQAPARLLEFYRRAELNKKMGRGRIWLREDLERERTTSVRALIGRVPLRPAVGGCRGSAIFVDDLPIDARELDSIDAADLEGVEIYRDALDMPHEYNGLCHVVLLWRKPYGENGKPLTWRRIAIAGGIALFVFLLAR